MTDDPYFAYVTAAYACSGLALAVLAVWTFLDARAARRRLAALEKAGHGRRSARKADL